MLNYPTPEKPPLGGFSGVREKTHNPCALVYLVVLFKYYLVL